MNVAERCSDWTAQDADDNAASTASKTAPSGGLSHYITGISGSYDAAVAGATLQLKDDTTVIAAWEVHNSLHVSFPSPIKITAGNATSAVLAASGTGGVTGRVNLIGYTK